MDSFGFTRKKFSGMAPQNKHRHLIRWLSGIYQSLSTNRVSPSAFNLFLYQYETALSWLDLPLPSRPDNRNIKSCMAYVSDGVNRHRHAAGMAAKDTHLLQPVTTCDRSAPAQVLPGPKLLVALDGLRSLFNVGAVFRACDAAGVPLLILGNTLGKEDERVRKTAMGTHEWVEQEFTPDLFQALSDWKTKGFAVTGVETRQGSCPVHQYNWPKRCVLVFGNEEYGLSDHVMAACNDFIHIPMFGRKNAMNVANAVSVVLFQARLSAVQTC